jgi:hypothetical protein
MPVFLRYSESASAITIAFIRIIALQGIRTAPAAYATAA